MSHRRIRTTQSPRGRTWLPPLGAIGASLLVALGAGCGEDDPDERTESRGAVASPLLASDVSSLTSEPESCNLVDDDADGLVDEGLGPLAWTRVFPGFQNWISDLVITPSDATVMVGSFHGTIDLGGISLTSQGGDDAYVVQHDAQGVPVFAYRFGDAADQGAYSVALSPAGDIVFGGHFQGTIDLGQGPYTALSPSGFVASRTAAGAHRWSTAITASGSVAVYGVAAAAGKVIVVGGYEGTLGIGSLPASGGLLDGFVAALDDATGALLWVRGVNGPGYEHVSEVAVDPSGKIFFSGHALGDVDFGAGMVTHVADADTFVGKLSANGTLSWAKVLPPKAGIVGVRLALDPSGNVLVTGGATPPVDFGGGILPYHQDPVTHENAGEDDAFVLKLDGSGNHVFSVSIATPSYDYGWAISSDAQGNALVVASSAESSFYHLPPYALPADILVHSLSPTGQPRWTKGFAAPGFQRFDHVVVGPSSHAVVVAGLLDDPMDLGSGTPEPQSSIDHANFLARFAGDACGPHPCTGGFMECDGNPFNGCETDTSTSLSSCGGCGVVCTNTHGSTSCQNGVCTPTCAGPYASCDGNASNGCEASTSSVLDCGACGNTCTNAHGVTNCVSGACIPTCSGWYYDCDGTPNDGCETDTSSDANHCGACGVSCGFSDTCSSGQCAQCGTTHLVIAGIQSSGNGGTQDEYVELKNPMAASVVLDGTWELWTKGSGGASYAKVWTGTDAVVPGHGHYLIAGTAYNGSKTPHGKLAASAVSDAASVQLRKAGAAVDTVCFNRVGYSPFITNGPGCEGTPLSNAPHDASGAGASAVDVGLERADGPNATDCVDTNNNGADFASNVSSVPSNNGLACGVSHLLVSEVQSRGTGGSGDEFIELYNPTAFAVTLSSTWSVEVKRADAQLANPYVVVWTGTGVTIPAYGHYLLFGPAFPGAFVGDAPFANGTFVADAASVVLKHSGAVVDALCFTTATLVGATAFTNPTYGFVCEGDAAVNVHQSELNAADTSLARRSGGDLASCTDTGVSEDDFIGTAVSGPKDSKAAPLP